MKSLRRHYRKSVNRLKWVFAVVLVTGLVALAVAEPQFFFVASIGLVLLSIFRWADRRSRTPEKYINENGYVVLSRTGELEHRFLARQILGRRLHSNEVVHHMNGRKTDNAIENLCLMDWEDHEIFHSWLRWRREKNGRYPTAQHQRRILEEKFNGVLLSEAPLENEVSQDFVSPEIFRRKLFVELRNERKRLSVERSVPAYEIFHDRVLHLMSEIMPDSKHMMLGIRGVGIEKYEAYGGYFIEVIRRFKAQSRIPSKKAE